MIFIQSGPKMGSTASKQSRKQKNSNATSALLIDGVQGTSSFASIGAASLSCLAAEHHQIHDEQALQLWKTKAIQTIEDLYEQKSSLLKHEAQMRTVLEQLRAIINEEFPRSAVLNDQRLKQIQSTWNSN